jgi:lysophospholipase L1-like esterase
MMHPHLKTSIQFLARGLLIVCITLLLLEAVLQLAAFGVEKRIHPLTGSELSADGKLRIVMMGDSNTYGLYLKEEESYPAVFEKNWNEKYPDRPVQVINLGFPGTNSSRVLKSFPDVIKAFSPDVITVMVGVNDFWTAPVNVEGVSESISSLEGWFRDHIRVYKLFYMMRRQAYQKDLLFIDQDPRGVTFDPERVEQYQAFLEGKAPPVSEDKPNAIHYGNMSLDIGYVMDAGRKQNPAEEIKRNMQMMADMAANNNIKLVFITYAFYEFPQKTANWQMKSVAKEKNVALVNPARTFREECAKGELRCGQLFFPDYHPTAEGYRLLAMAIEKFFTESDSVVKEEL